MRAGLCGIVRGCWQVDERDESYFQAKEPEWER